AAARDIAGTARGRADDHVDQRRARGGGDDDALAVVEREVQVLTGLVGAVGRTRDARDDWWGGDDDRIRLREGAARSRIALYRAVVGNEVGVVRAFGQRRLDDEIGG